MESSPCFRFNLNTPEPLTRTLERFREGGRFQTPIGDVSPQDLLLRDMSGAVEDWTFLYELGAALAGSEERPAWSPTSEFRAIRERQRP